MSHPIMEKISNEAVPAGLAAATAYVASMAMGVQGETSIFGIQMPLAAAVAGSVGLSHLTGEIAADYILPELIPHSSEGLRSLEQKVLPVALSGAWTYMFLKMRYPGARPLETALLGAGSSYVGQMGAELLLNKSGSSTY